MEHSEASPPPGTSTPASTATLSADSVDVLRRGLRSRIAGSATEAELRRAIGAVCADAHRLEIPAEQLILIVKDVWHRMPEARHLRRSLRQDELLSGTITLCIEEYYARMREEPPRRA